jgi:hypothetical protein
MACYDVSATMTVSVVVEMQIDAMNPAEAEAQARDLLAREWPDVRDGICYDSQIEEVNVRGRK